ncbi:unnamed protein product [Arctogadus glacialis]
MNYYHQFQPTTPPAGQQELLLTVPSNNTPCWSRKATITSSTQRHPLLAEKRSYLWPLGALALQHNDPTLAPNVETTSPLTLEGAAAEKTQTTLYPSLADDPLAQYLTQDLRPIPVISWNGRKGRTREEEKRREDARTRSQKEWDVPPQVTKGPEYIQYKEDFSDNERTHGGPTRGRDEKPRYERRYRDTDKEEPLEDHLWEGNQGGDPRIRGEDKRNGAGKTQKEPRESDPTCLILNNEEEEAHGEIWQDQGSQERGRSSASRSACGRNGQPSTEGARHPMTTRSRGLGPLVPITPGHPQSQAPASWILPSSLLTPSWFNPDLDRSSGPHTSQSKPRRPRPGEPEDFKAPLLIDAEGRAAFHTMGPAGHGHPGLPLATAHGGSLGLDQKI